MSGPLFTTGFNQLGQLGDGSTDPRSSPVSIIRSGPYVAVKGGGLFTVAIDSAGAIWAWGANDYGQLGNNSQSPYSSPISIRRGGSYVAVNAGLGHTVAIDSAGMIWAWGQNTSGQLGNNSLSSPYPSPISIRRGGSYVAVSAGDYHTVALDSKGMIWAWGDNWDGQLGDNDPLTNKSSPVSIARVRASSFIAINAGSYHTLAIDSDGMVWAWGYNYYGGVGYGGDLISSPVPISRIGSYIDIAGGRFHSVFLEDSSPPSPSPRWAFFIASPEYGKADLTVHFTDTSTDNPNRWYWDFGDGHTSTLQNPTHTYTTAGNHIVTLTVTRA